MNVTASADAQDGSTSFPAPAVILVNAPLTFPVARDRTVSQRFDVSPLPAGKTTLLVAASQQPGLGTLGSVDNGVPAESRPCSPARSNASYMPVLTGWPPPVATIHQSRKELCIDLAEVYPTIRRCLPSGDQTGHRALVKSGPTRRGCPPATGTTQTAPFPGTATDTLSMPTQYATCEPSGENLGFNPSRASNRASPPNAGIS